MFKKLTAIAFMLVMTLLITLKHPVLGYCLCLNTYVTGDCLCSVNHVDKDNQHSSPSKAAEPSSPRCSSCHTVNSVAPHENDQSPVTQPPSELQASLPCDDCIKKLIVDVGEYLWNNPDQHIADPAHTLTKPHFARNNRPWPSHLNLETPLAIRGDPPPEPLPGIEHSYLPHYLIHSVMRL